MYAWESTTCPFQNPASLRSACGYHRRWRRRRSSSTARALRKAATASAPKRTRTAGSHSAPISTGASVKARRSQ